MATKQDKEHERRLEELEAARRQYATPQDRLRWFIDFADSNLANLSPIQRELQTYNLRAMMRLANDAWKYKSLAPMSSAKLSQIQGEIRGAFKKLLYKGMWEFPGPKSIIIQRWSDVQDKELNIGVHSYTQKEELVALHALAYAIVEARASLRWCRRCFGPFVASKRQEYCSTNCSQLTRNEKKKKQKEAKKEMSR